MGSNFGIGVPRKHQDWAGLWPNPHKGYYSDGTGGVNRSEIFNEDLPRPHWKKETNLSIFSEHFHEAPTSTRKKLAKRYAFVWKVTSPNGHTPAPILPLEINRDPFGDHWDPVWKPKANPENSRRTYMSSIRIWPTISKVFRKYFNIARMLGIMFQIDLAMVTSFSSLLNTPKTSTCVVS